MNKLRDRLRKSLNSKPSESNIFKVGKKSNIKKNVSEEPISDAIISDEEPNRDDVIEFIIDGGIY